MNEQFIYEQFTTLQIFGIKKALGMGRNGIATCNGVEYLFQIDYWDDLVNKGYAEKSMTINQNIRYQITFETAKLFQPEMDRQYYNRLSSNWVSFDKRSKKLQKLSGRINEQK